MTRVIDDRPKKKLLVWNTIGQGLQVRKKNVWQLLGFQGAFLCISSLLHVVMVFFFPDTSTADWYFLLPCLIAIFFLDGYFFMGLLTLSLRFVDGIAFRFTDLFPKMRLVWDFTAVWILLLFCTYFNSVFFIIPGIIIAVRCSLFGYFIADKNMGLFAALNASWYLVKGATFRMFGFWFVCLFVMTLGFMSFGDFLGDRYSNLGVSFALLAIVPAGGLLYRKLELNDVTQSYCSIESTNLSS